MSPQDRAAHSPLPPPSCSRPHWVSPPWPTVRLLSPSAKSSNWVVSAGEGLHSSLYLWRSAPHRLQGPSWVHTLCCILRWTMSLAIPALGFHCHSTFSDSAQVWVSHRPDPGTQQRLQYVAHPPSVVVEHRGFFPMFTPIRLALQPYQPKEHTKDLPPIKLLSSDQVAFTCSTQQCPPPCSTETGSFFSWLWGQLFNGNIVSSLLS